MRYSIALAVALSFPLGCQKDRELYSSPDNSVWVEKFSSGGREVKIKGYIFGSQEGDLVGLYTKSDPDPYIEFRPEGSVNSRIFIDHPKRDLKSDPLPVDSSSVVSVPEHEISTDKRLEEYEFYKEQIQREEPKATVREE